MRSTISFFGTSDATLEPNDMPACIDQVVTDRYALYNGDSCEVLPTFPDESIHLSIYSPPFATEGGGCLYHYTSSDRDLSNCRSYEEFFTHYEYIVEQIARVTMPGRISAVHCMDVPKKGANIAGYIDFPGDIIRLHEKHGFEYLPRICIWKEPLEVRNRTLLKSLAHWQIVEDSTLTNVAAGDYLIPFRKRGVNQVPVTHPEGLLEYEGEREIPSDLRKYRNWKGKQIENRYSHWIWRQYASCFWDDIRMSKMLRYNDARDKDDERHAHPLQLDVIARACVLWSNPGERVLTPFAGVGSEVYGAVVNGRFGVGVELKPSYFAQAVRNLAAASDIPSNDDQTPLLTGMQGGDL
jgi:DNA modification methylase